MRRVDKGDREKKTKFRNNMTKKKKCKVNILGRKV
jgi:hypothetical protein